VRELQQTTIAQKIEESKPVKTAKPAAERQSEGTVRPWDSG